MGTWDGVLGRETMVPHTSQLMRNAPATTLASRDRHQRTWAATRTNNNSTASRIAAKRRRKLQTFPQPRQATNEVFVRHPCF